MEIYILISLVVFLVYDYNFFNFLFDNFLSFNSSGSKIKNITGSLNTNKKLELKIIGINFALSFVLFLVNSSIASIVLNTNVFVISIGKYKLDFTSLLGSNYRTFCIIYYFSSFLFFLICSFRFKLDKYFLKKSQSTSQKYCEGLILSEGLTIPNDYLYQNIIITGSIGSGKTSGAICHIVEYLVKCGNGGVILDAKSNFVNILKNICQKNNRVDDIKEISLTSNYFFNILDNNISATEMAGRIKKVIELISDTNNSDSYWLDKVENVLLNFLILIDYYTDKKRNVLEIHKLAISKEYLKDKMNEVKDMVISNPPNDSVSYELANVFSFLNDEYLNLDSRVFSIINSEITRFTIPLVTEHNIYERFAVNALNLKEIDFSNISKNIVIISINIGEYRLLSKIISTFIKLSFQKHILSALSKDSRPSTFFVSDEYQEFVNKEDAHFFSLAREANCINVISTQSYSSIKYVLKDVDATNVIIQNFVNKIWFRNDDNYTIQECIKQLGKVDVQKENVTISENANESKKYLFRKGFKSIKSSLSNSLSYVTTKENQYDENFFTQELKTFEALTFVYNKDDKIYPRKVKFERWKINEEENQNSIDDCIDDVFNI